MLKRAMAMALMGTVLMMTSACVTENNNTALLPAADYLSRDIRDEVFYFVMPDRFNNGDGQNDQGSNTHAISRGGFDPTDKNKYHGGDISGLRAKLDYLQKMGITSIWMTPIMRNQALQGDIAGYHGYWVLDFTHIDPHLGSNAELKGLIEDAHARGIRVFFDIITNHSADVIKLKECHEKPDGSYSTDYIPCPYRSLAEVASDKGYTPVVPPGMEGIKHPAWLNEPDYYHNQGDTTFTGENSVYGDFFGLDDINTDDPRVVSGMIEIFKQLISEFKPDGFRIDTVKHVNIEFWQAFAPAIMDHARAVGIPNFFMFGEVYDSNPAVLSRYTTEGKLESVLDFGFQRALVETLVEDKGTRAFAKLFSNDHLYQDEDSHSGLLLNFSGNHDMGRFGYFLKQRHPHMSDDELVARSKLANALLFFGRGIPVIYYGDEQGFVGDGGNQDSRQDMMPSKVAEYNDDVLIGTALSTADNNFDPSHPLYRDIQQLSGLYQAEIALRQGHQQVLYSSDEPGILALSRRIDGQQEEVLVVFNTSTAPKTVSLDVAGDNYMRLTQTGEITDLDQGQLRLSLPALSFMLVKAIH